MKIISLVSRKGGSGKSTLTIHWGVHAASQGEVVALLDMDPQGTTTKWYERREAQSPIVIPTSPQMLARHLDVCRNSGVTLVLIDTLPDIDRTALVAISQSELVLIPCRPSLPDIDAIGATAQLAHGLQTPAAVVLNQVVSTTKDARGARQAIAGYGLPICPRDIRQRVAFQRSLIGGLTAEEVRRYSDAQFDIEGSWNWVINHQTIDNREVRP